MDIDRERPFHIASTLPNDVEVLSCRTFSSPHFPRSQSSPVLSDLATLCILRY